MDLNTTTREEEMSGVTFTTEDGSTGTLSVSGSLETIYEYLYLSQSHRLSSEDRLEVYLQGDGFGDTSQPGEIREQIREYTEGGMDWSHIRDSSPEGIYRVLTEICKRQK
jgi:hypothetical protein